MDDQTKHKCGVFGIWDDADSAHKCYTALYAQQHRGQESCGIVASNGREHTAHRAMGLVADHPDADLLVISCTDYRALEAVTALEQALAKPVVTSNSALMYVCLKRLGLDFGDIDAGGYLYTRRN